MSIVAGEADDAPSPSATSSRRVREQVLEVARAQVDRDRRPARRWRPRSGRSPGGRRRPPAGRSPARGRSRPAAAIAATSRSWGSAWAVIAVAADHRLGGDEGVDDRLLGRLDRRVEQRVERRIEDHPQSADDVCRGRRRRPVGSARGCRSRRRGSRSPLVVPPVPADPADPERRRWATRSHWWGRSGASVATITMIEPLPGSGGGPVARSGVGDERRPGSPRRPGRRRRGAIRAGRSSPGRGRRASTRRRSSAMRRDAVPIPPLNSWQIIPVPPPTLPSRDRPGGGRRECGRVRRRPSRGSRRCR